VLGAVRVSLVAPALGATLAVELETPLMLALSWLVAGRCVARFQVARGSGARTGMGAVALAVLLAAEWITARLAFQRTTAEFLAGYHTVAGCIGLLAQIAFACIPIVSARLGR